MPGDPHRADRDAPREVQPLSRRSTMAEKPELASALYQAADLSTPALRAARRALPGGGPRRRGGVGAPADPLHGGAHRRGAGPDPDGHGGRRRPAGRHRAHGRAAPRGRVAGEQRPGGGLPRARRAGRAGWWPSGSTRASRSSRPSSPAASRARGSRPCSPPAPGRRRCGWTTSSAWPGFIHPGDSVDVIVTMHGDGAGTGALLEGLPAEHPGAGGRQGPRRPAQGGREGLPGHRGHAPRHGGAVGAAGAGGGAGQAPAHAAGPHRPGARGDQGRDPATLLASASRAARRRLPSRPAPARRSARPPAAAAQAGGGGHPRRPLRAPGLPEGGDTK